MQVTILLGASAVHAWEHVARRWLARRPRKESISRKSAL